MTVILLFMSCLSHLKLYTNKLNFKPHFLFVYNSNYVSITKNKQVILELFYGYDNLVIALRLSAKSAQMYVLCIFNEHTIFINSSIITW